jgi:hypothetical protein
MRAINPGWPLLINEWKILNPFTVQNGAKPSAD